MYKIAMFLNVLPERLRASTFPVQALKTDERISIKCIQDLKNKLKSIPAFLDSPCRRYELGPQEKWQWGAGRAGRRCC